VTSNVVQQKLSGIAAPFYYVGEDILLVSLNPARVSLAAIMANK
jgi:hypothetical protein